jgi:hypothetical protein
MPFADRNRQLDYHHNYNNEHYKILKKQKVCPRCKEPLDDENIFCSKCRKEKNVISFSYREKHKKDYNEKQRGYARKYRKINKKLVFTHYGGNPPKCACCGESHMEFLAIDHINGGGNKQRKQGLNGHTLYAWLIKNNYPEGYRVLCHNCNLARGFYGYCPHEKG